MAACCRCRRVTGESTPRKTTLRTRRGGEYYRVTSRRHLPQTIESNDSAIKALTYLSPARNRARRNILIGRPWRTTPRRIHPTLRSKVRSNRIELIATERPRYSRQSGHGGTARSVPQLSRGILIYGPLASAVSLERLSAESYKDTD